MKKVFLIILLSSFMIACSKAKTAKQIAEEVCDCSKKANDLPTTDPTRQDPKDCGVKQVEAWDKVKDDQKKLMNLIKFSAFVPQNKLIKALANNSPNLKVPGR
ncbi:MAG: hypothetical protein IPL04_07555 [Chitinophagaceae bacterium]|nr:hypothetical protein [Chitinophagaceae bacterium]